MDNNHCVKLGALAQFKLNILHKEGLFLVVSVK